MNNPGKVIMSAMDKVFVPLFEALKECGLTEKEIREATKPVCQHAADLFNGENKKACK